MDEETIMKEYLRFMDNPKNAFRCEECPDNPYPGTRCIKNPDDMSYPCEHQICMVVMHSRKTS